MTAPQFKLGDKVLYGEDVAEIERVGEYDDYAFQYRYVIRVGGRRKNAMESSLTPVSAVDDIEEPKKGQTTTRSRIFRMFEKAVARAWGRDGAKLVRLVLSPERPKHKGVLASVTYDPRAVVVIDGKLRRGSTTPYTLRLHDKLLSMPLDKVEKLMLHEALHIGYSKHDAGFIRAAKRLGAPLSEMWADEPGWKVQRKQGSRYKTLKTFEDKNEARQWGMQESRRDPDGKYRLIGETVTAARKVIAYHGSSVPVRRFNRKYSAQGVFWFSEDRAKIERGESGAVSAKYIMTCELTVDKTAGWDQYEKLLLAQLRNDGYDSINLDDDWVIFDSKRIKVLKAERRAEASVTTAHRVNIRPKLRSGKKVVGPNGNEAVGYEWRSRVEDVYSKREGGLVAKRVSDWDRYEWCATCNRKIVHIFWVKLKDTGETLPYGGDHLHVGLGYPRELTKPQVDRFKRKVANLDQEAKQERDKADYYTKAYSKLIDKRAVSIDEPNPSRRANEKWRESKLPTPPSGPYELVWLLNRSKRLLMRADGNYASPELWDKYAPGWERIDGKNLRATLDHLNAWRPTEASVAAAKQGAYWLFNNGKLVDVDAAGTHAHHVEQNPKQFGLTAEQVDYGPDAYGLDFTAWPQDLAVKIFSKAMRVSFGPHGASFITASPMTARHIKAAQDTLTKLGVNPYRTQIVMGPWDGSTYRVAGNDFMFLKSPRDLKAVTASVGQDWYGPAGQRYRIVEDTGDGWRVEIQHKSTDMPAEESWTFSKQQFERLKESLPLSGSEVTDVATAAPTRGKWLAFRGTGPKGLKDLRPSSEGVHGPGIYFYAAAVDARGYAERGGGVIVAEVRGTRYSQKYSSDVIVAESAKDVRVLGTVPTDRTIDRDDYLAAVRKIAPTMGAGAATAAPEMPFEVGDLVKWGKYKNKTAKIKRFGTNDKGQVTVLLEPVPKGRKKDKELGLFKIWTTPDKVEAVASPLTAATLVQECADIDDGWQLGLRSVPEHVRAGQRLAPSYRWVDNERTDELLRGTSAIGLRSTGQMDSPVTPRSATNALRKMKQYVGTGIALLAGAPAGYGEDDDEVLIRNAEVMAYWRGATSANAHREASAATVDERFITMDHSDATKKQKATGASVTASVTASELLYHGTRGPLASSIMKKGLRQDSGFSNFGGQAGVSFTTDLNVAKQFGNFIVAVDRKLLERTGYKLDAVQHPTAPNEHEVRVSKGATTVIPPELFAKVLLVRARRYELKWWQEDFPDVKVEVASVTAGGPKPWTKAAREYAAERGIADIRRMKPRKASVAGKAKMPWELTFKEFANPLPKPRAGYQLLYHYTKANLLDAIARTGLKRSGGAVFAHQNYEFSGGEKPLVVFQAPKEEVRRESGGGTVTVLRRDIDAKDVLGTFDTIWPRPGRLAVGREEPVFRSDIGARLGKETGDMHRAYLEAAVVRGFDVPAAVMRDYPDLDPKDPDTFKSRYGYLLRKRLESSVTAAAVGAPEMPFEVGVGEVIATDQTVSDLVRAGHADIAYGLLETI